MYSLNLYLGFRLSLRDVREHLPGRVGLAQPPGAPVGAPGKPRREALLPEGPRSAFRLQPHPLLLPRRPAITPNPGEDPHPDTAKSTGVKNLS